MDKNSNEVKIAIIGFSRFGQLWAKLMKPYGQITVFNRSDKSSIAKELNVDFFSFDELEKIKEADWIFLAVAISATKEIIEKIKPLVKSGALVMDVCSVKMLPCQWLQAGFNTSIQIMGTHPMFGPDSAKTGLAGKQMVLCPVRITADNLDKIKKICEGLKLKVIETTPEEHDRQSAYSLAMVHFLGRGLDKLNLKNIEITTLGFDRLMQIQETVINDSPELFRCLHEFNPFTSKVRRELQNALNEVDRNLKPPTTNQGE